MTLKSSIFVWIVLAFVCASRSEAQSAEVYWNNVDQQIDGFGASNGGTGIEPWQATFFFSTGPGDLGLSLLRTVVPSDGSCVTINQTCAGQVAGMQLAIAQGAKIWSTPFSPPASMKSNGSTICDTGSGTGTLNPESYQRMRRIWRITL
jgi:O-glycosyl hydrolase